MGTAVAGAGASGTARAGSAPEKLEVVTVPVADPARSVEFYRRLGWRQDETPPGRHQFTPPGSACSVQFGAGLVDAAPGSAQRLVLAVPDVVAAREGLKERGVETGDVFHLGPDGALGGVDPDRRSYSSLCAFEDPDGNGWLMQEVTTRLPGRVDPGPTRFSSAADLADALRRAAAAHGEHEKRTGAYDEGWPDWYATYMVREQSGGELPV